MNKFFFIAILALVSILACNKDDEMSCELPAVDVNILGKWSPNNSTDEVEFRTGGVLIDEDDAILGFSDEPETKTYEFISGLDSIRIVATSQSGFVESTFKIDNEDCDAFKLGIIGITQTYIRVN